MKEGADNRNRGKKRGGEGRLRCRLGGRLRGDPALSSAHNSEVDSGSDSAVDLEVHQAVESAVGKRSKWRTSKSLPKTLLRSVAFARGSPFLAPSQ